MKFFKIATKDAPRFGEQLALDLGKLSESSERLKERVVEVEGTLAELRAEISREKLSMAELYDKTYHLLKRHEARERKAAREPEEQLELPPEEAPSGEPAVDSVTERVMNRRRRTGGISPVVPR